MIILLYPIIYPCKKCTPICLQQILHFYPQKTSKTFSNDNSSINVLFFSTDFAIFLTYLFLIEGYCFIVFHWFLPNINMKQP